MNKMTHTLIALSLLISAAQAAEQKEKALPTDINQITDAETHMGPTKMEEKSFDNLRIFGPATLSKITVTGSMGIAGPLTIEKSTINKLLATGTVKAKKLTLSTA